MERECNLIHGIACAPSRCSASKGYAYVIRVAHKLESIALVVSDQVANDLYRKPQIVHSNYGYNLSQTMKLLRFYL